MDLESGTPPATVPGRRWRRAALVLVLLAGTAVRLIPWNDVFTPVGVRFLPDTDPHYHVLRAQRIAVDWPHVPWDDPRMNYPVGAVIPWPPLFDETIATAAVVAGGGHATPALVERSAAFVPVVLGVATLAVVAALGNALLAPPWGLLAAFLLALLPAHTAYSSIGEADQHVAELLLFCIILLAFTSSFRAGRPARRAFLDDVLLGAAIALAFWNWMGSALYLATLAAFTATWHLAAPAGDRRAAQMARSLARGAGLGALFLALSLAALGPPGALARGSLSGLTGTHVGLVAATAAFGATLWAASRRGTARGVALRLAAIGAGTVPGLLAWGAVPPFRHGVAQGLAALARSNPWYTRIGEFRPFFLGGEPIANALLMAGKLYGLGLVVMPLAALALRRDWRERPDRRPETLLLAAWGAGFLALTLARRRFDLYLTVPMVLWAAMVLRAGSAAIAARLRRWGGAHLGALQGVSCAAGAALFLTPGMGTLLSAEHVESTLSPAVIAALTWLRSAAPSQGRPAVLASWPLGHAVQYFAGAPVVATPFGTEGGAGAMEDTAAFFTAADPAQAAEILRRREVGTLVLGSPSGPVLDAAGFAPAGTPELVHERFDWLRGTALEVDPRVFGLVASRLYLYDGGSPPPPLPAAASRLDEYRLLYESLDLEELDGMEVSAVKVFGVVPGAALHVSGARPGSSVSASTRVLTNRRRAFTWTSSALAGADGIARLRLPYATGANGLCTADAYTISDETAAATVSASSGDVEQGTPMRVELSRSRASR